MCGLRNSRPIQSRIEVPKDAVSKRVTVTELDDDNMFIHSTVIRTFNTSSVKKSYSKVEVRKS